MQPQKFFSSFFSAWALIACDVQLRSQPSTYYPHMIDMTNFADWLLQTMMRFFRACNFLLAGSFFVPSVRYPLLLLFFMDFCAPLLHTHECVLVIATKTRKKARKSMNFEVYWKVNRWKLEITWIMMMIISIHIGRHKTGNVQRMLHNYDAFFACSWEVIREIGNYAN